ncbi:hypothetical protein TNCV_4614581 [Trichonephila clavipes]|nr:hypothetical protein TNCV_4614581 [Trichonephila clavipes]
MGKQTTLVWNKKIPSTEIDKFRKIIEQKYNRHFVAFPARPRHALLAKDLVTCQAMVGRHILEDIVGRVAHCQSALKDHDDRVSQEIVPHTVTPCEIAVCRSTINAGSEITCAVVQH